MVVSSTPASTTLVGEVDWLAPGRDRASDGTIGDAAHQAESSDHNPDDTPGVVTPYSDADSVPEVHARDIDASGPWPGAWSMERIVETVVSRHRAGLDARLQYAIYDRRIWSRSWGWTQRDYTGPNPHDKHAHFSFRYGSGSGATNPENDTKPWGIRAAREAEVDAMTPEDRSWLASTVRAIVAEEVDKRAGDIVRRYNPDGSWVAPDDSNPRMTVASGVEYAGRDANQVRAEVHGVVVPMLERIDATLADLAAKDANSVPAGIAGEVVDELAARVARPAT